MTERKLCWLHMASHAVLYKQKKLKHSLELVAVYIPRTPVAMKALSSCSYRGGALTSSHASIPPVQCAMLIDAIAWIIACQILVAICEACLVHRQARILFI